MKKGIFFLLGIITLTTVSANDVLKPTSKIGVNYSYSDAVSFVERGVQFHIFLNGEFDFDTHYRAPRYVDYYGKRVRVTQNRGVRVERDYYGRVTRVGNTFINYDVRNNVKRVGSVYIGYRLGQLDRVGNLKVQYDRWGNPRFYGSVKQQDHFYNNAINVDFRLGSVCDYNDPYFYRNDFRRNYSQIREDNNFFYYKAKPNAKIGKRSKVLKRRKPVDTRYSKSAVRSKRNNNSSNKSVQKYRKQELRKDLKKDKVTRKSSRN